MIGDDGAGVHHLELWGGVECTINRVGDEYFSQIHRSAHIDRVDDLDRFAALGIRAIRYPVLWEHVAPAGLERADWRWPDERLERLRSLGVRPIVVSCITGAGRGTPAWSIRRFPKNLPRTPVLSPPGIHGCGTTRPSTNR